MFFDCKHDRRLQNIQSWAISKILDMKSIFSKRHPGSRIEYFKKEALLDICPKEFLL